MSTRYLCVLAIILAWFHFAEAQQPQKQKMFNIDYLSVLSRSSDSARREAFHRGLTDLGYVEGKNFAIEPRYADGKLDQLPKLAAELVRLNVDVIVAGGSTAIGAAKNATKLIPIVMAHGSDPVELRYVATPARPRRNITGLTPLAPELGGKRLELLKDIVPGLSRVAVLTDPGTGGHRRQIKELESAAPGLALQLQAAEVREPNELETLFSTMVAGRPGALSRCKYPHWIDFGKGSLI